MSRSLLRWGRVAAPVLASGDRDGELQSIAATAAIGNSQGAEGTKLDKCGFEG
jgi:hypothetical protein